MRNHITTYLIWVISFVSPELRDFTFNSRRQLMQTDSYIPLGSEEVVLPKVGNCLLSEISLCQSGIFLLLVQKSQAGIKQGARKSFWCSDDSPLHKVHFIKWSYEKTLLVHRLSCNHFPKAQGKGGEKHSGERAGLSNDSLRSLLIPWRAEIQLGVTTDHINNWKSG